MADKKEKTPLLDELEKGRVFDRPSEVCVVSESGR
jgi:hypothetical protein